jgi:RNA polymerase sigma-54 factor
MALSAKLQLRQSQALVMTPQLMQSIRLLQFTHMELERFVDEEIERNPLLERQEPAEDAGRDEPEPSGGGDGDADWFSAGLDASSETVADRLDTSLEHIFPDDPGVHDRLGPDLSLTWKSAAAGQGPGDGAFDFEDMAAATVTLRDMVDEQIAFAFPDRAKALIARELADALDDTGYLRADLCEIAARLGTDRATVEAVLETCQGFDPAGLFARDLRECLALQLRRRDRFDPAMEALIAHLELLAKRDFAALRRICKVDEGDLIDMLGSIRSRARASSRAPPRPWCPTWS